MALTMQYFENIIKQFSKTYKELEGVKVKIDLNNKLYKGFCHSIPNGEYKYIGKMRLMEKKTTHITLTHSDPTILFTFLHEMTHAITPYYERKVKNNWIRIDHSDKFYKNFHEVIQIAFDKGIIDTNYTLKELMKKDGSKENYYNDMLRFGNANKKN